METANSSKHHRVVAHTTGELEGGWKIHTKKLNESIFSRFSAGFLWSLLNIRHHSLSLLLFFVTYANYLETLCVVCSLCCVVLKKICKFYKNRKWMRKVFKFFVWAMWAYDNEIILKNEREIVNKHKLKTINETSNRSLSRSVLFSPLLFQWSTSTTRIAIDAVLMFTSWIGLNPL